MVNRWPHSASKAAHRQGGKHRGAAQYRAHTVRQKRSRGRLLPLHGARGGANPALDARLRVYYDGSPNASIDIDMGTLLATHWGAGSADTSQRWTTPAPRWPRWRPGWGARPRLSEAGRSVGARATPDPVLEPRRRWSPTHDRPWAAQVWASW
jgi:hypothetical protein